MALACDSIFLGDNLDVLSRFEDASFRLDLHRPAVQHRPTADAQDARDAVARRTATARASAAGATRAGCSPSRPTATRSTTTRVPRAAPARGAPPARRRGTLYFHIDYREAHYCKLLLDEIFGRECFLNEIIWAYDYGARAKQRWPAKHDTILVYVKDPARYHFDARRSIASRTWRPGLVTAGEGRAREAADRRVVAHDRRRPTGARIVPTRGREKTGYPTQKPEGIVRRMVLASTEPGDWCLDFFAGSGTLGAVAARTGRRYVLVDSNPEACAVMQARLGLAVSEPPPSRETASGAPPRPQSRSASASFAAPTG